MTERRRPLPEDDDQPTQPLSESPPQETEPEPTIRAEPDIAPPVPQQPVEPVQPRVYSRSVLTKDPRNRAVIYEISWLEWTIRAAFLLLGLFLGYFVGSNFA